ncbi:hypothetical protein EV384_2497 [Micromonospora kangleipakensis]|uniref:Uncharacterized protein n=1 Tax=Micromonospora kangleipakensis TaxID=1077942 RepID=A0A4V2GD06_9ACTN|nr:hypothetical protein EV384_2497 [Micromonospora kangleipakensis]
MGEVRAGARRGVGMVGVERGGRVEREAARKAGDRRVAGAVDVDVDRGAGDAEPVDRERAQLRAGQRSYRHPAGGHVGVEPDTGLDEHDRGRRRPGLRPAGRRVRHRAADQRAVVPAVELTILSFQGSWNEFPHSLVAVEGADKG